MSVVRFLEEQLTADWEDHEELSDVWVKATQGELKAFSRVTVIVSQQTIGPFPQAPHAKRTVGVTLEVVSPTDDIDAAADELELIVPAILDYLDPLYLHDVATAFLYGGLLAYRIPLTVIANKEN